MAVEAISTGAARRVKRMMGVSAGGWLWRVTEGGTREVEMAGRETMSADV